MKNRLMPLATQALIFGSFLFLTLPCFSQQAQDSARSPVTEEINVKADYEKGLQNIGNNFGVGNMLGKTREIAENIYLADPNSPYSYLLIAKLQVIRMKEGDQEMAEFILGLADQAASLDPEESDVHVIRARVMLLTGQFREALAEADLALEMEPANADAMYAKGKIYKRLDSFQQAEDWYLKAIDAYPDPGRKSVTHSEIGDMWLDDLKDMEKAAKHRKIGVDLVPDGPWILSNYSTFLHNYTKDYELAADYARRALAIMNYGAARTSLGISLYAQWAENYLAGGATVDELDEIALDTGVTFQQAHEYDTRYMSDMRISEALIKSEKVSRPMFPGGTNAHLIPEDDLLAIWESSLTQPETGARRGKQTMAISQLAYSNPLRALELIETVPSLNERTQLRQIALSRGSVAQPEVMLQLVPELSSEQEKDLVVSNAIGALAKQNPSKAFELALQQPNDTLRKSGVSNALAAWTLVDLDAAKHAYATLPDRETYPYARNILVQKVVESDPGNALDWAEAVAGVRSVLWKETFIRVAPLDSNLALEAIASIDHQQTRIKLLGDLVRTLGSTQPKIAAQMVESMPEGPIRLKATVDVTFNWARIDIASAWAWLNGQPHEIFEQAAGQLANRWADMHVDFRKEIPLGEIPQGATMKWMESLVGSYGRSDLDGAMEWLTQYSDYPEYETWQGYLIVYLARQEPAAAVEKLDQIENQESYDKAAGNVLNTWVYSDAEAAARWVENNTRSNYRGGMVRSVAMAWCKYDQQGCLEWVLSIEPSDQRDQGLSGVLIAMPLHAKDLLPVFDVMRNEDIKKDARWRVVMKKGREQGIDAADQLMLDLGVDEAERQTYLGRLKRNIH